MIQQHAVSIDGEKVDDINAVVPTQGTLLFKVGKRRFCKVIFS
jgi:tyrosyl-tRNA synthetase